MIYIDALFGAKPFGYRDGKTARTGSRNGHQWCHLWTDGGVEELHAFAAKIGLKRSWFQDRPRFPHYDLVPSKRALAIALGAKEINLREWIERRMKQKLLLQKAGGEYKETT